MARKRKRLDRAKGRKKSVRYYRPGPITNNGYLNFLRDFRKKHYYLKPRELIMRAARSWNRLDEIKKDHYKRIAWKVTALREKRPVCDKCKEDIKVLTTAFISITSPEG